MSALLPIAKGYRALARALEDQSAKCTVPSETAILTRLAWAHVAAADDLERQARAEASAEPGTTWRPLSGDKRKV